MDDKVFWSNRWWRSWGSWLSSTAKRPERPTTSWPWPCPPGRTSASTPRSVRSLVRSLVKSLVKSIVRHLEDTYPSRPTFMLWLGVPHVLYRVLYHVLSKVKVSFIVNSNKCPRQIEESKFSLSQTHGELSLKVKWNKISNFYTK